MGNIGKVYIEENTYIDFERSTFTKGSISFSLSQRETKLLLMLWERRESIVFYDQLFELFHYEIEKKRPFWTDISIT